MASTALSFGLSQVSFSGLSPLSRAVVNLGVGVTRNFAADIDDNIFGRDTRKQVTEGSRLSDLSVQTSTYGKNIPHVWGSVKLAGNIIWSQPIKEQLNVNESGGKGIGASLIPSAPERTVTKSYAYFATFAIALCEGEIDNVLRVWADTKLINPTELASGYTVYKGTDSQLPDSIIESFEGVSNTPAYRNLAYVVFEDLALAPFGNRIPNFEFEVKRRVIAPNEDVVEDKITGMIMIPGAGEFVYDTEVHTKNTGIYTAGTFFPNGKKEIINQNNDKGKADALVSLDQLQETCPNLEYVGIVVTWFADSLDIGTASITPRVEYKGSTNSPSDWNVAGIDRESAQLISFDNGTPRYGGTPNDASLLRYIDEIKARGLKVMLYPMIFVDLPDKPWRGRMGGNINDVTNFFNKTSGYNAFINHYANLTASKVDAFIIGTEMRELTSITDGSGAFPAVNEFVNLAASVKAIMGSATKITYAADWSEYHHTTGGWYNLDPLWASPDIDFIGIDAYFPLTNLQAGERATKDDIINGWQSGEGYDYFYADSTNRTGELPLAAEYAWKNLDWFINNNHVNPDGLPTAWVPNSKKIWFTEYGFPSVDISSNQPNVFYDPASSESAFPFGSEGNVDFLAQRTAIDGTEDYLAMSSVVENQFLWTWDARPYPFFPDLNNVWDDGGNWQFGHWVNGKLCLTSLAGVVADISAKAELIEYDVECLNDIVEGFIQDSRYNANSALQQLRESYFFDSVEHGESYKYLAKSKESVGGNLEISRYTDIQKSRLDDFDMPSKIDVNYIDRQSNYKIGNVHADRVLNNTENSEVFAVPLVMNAGRAKFIADTQIYSRHENRDIFTFAVAQENFNIEPADIIELEGENAKLRVLAVRYINIGEKQLLAVKDEPCLYSYFNNLSLEANTDALEVIQDTQLKLLDIPLLPNQPNNEQKIFYGVTYEGASFGGASIIENDTVVGSTINESTIGTTMTALPDFEFGNVWDEVSELEVQLFEGELSSVTRDDVLNGANIAYVNGEIIQFSNAQLVGGRRYILSDFLRGRLGTEHAIANHGNNECFAMIDYSLSSIVKTPSDIGLSLDYKAVTNGQDDTNIASQSFNYNAVALKPYAPALHYINYNGSDTEISWHRRTRYNGLWRDNVDVSNSEAEELYCVEVLDNSGAVIHTEQVSESKYTTNLGSNFKVYQISDLIGKGYPLKV